jgi:hypothetical protein
LAESFFGLHSTATEAVSLAERLQEKQPLFVGQARHETSDEERRASLKPSQIIRPVHHNT